MKNTKYYEISTIYECVCNIWMICLKFNWFIYDQCWMLHLSEFLWTILSWAWVVFNNFLLIDTTDRSKISSCQKHLFFAVSLYPFHFSRTLPLRRRLFLTNYCPINIEHCNCVVVLRKMSFKPLSHQYCGRYWGSLTVPRRTHNF